MESGTVKLTPQWLSFTNNQPQGEDRRGSHSNNDYRERYDRGGGGGRYGGFSSSKTSQYPFSERSKPVSISPAPSSNGMGYPSADSSSKPAYTKQQSIPKRDEGYLYSQSQPQQISAPVPAPAPAPTDAQEYPLRLSSPPQPATTPPKSSYDKNFPSLYGNGFGGYSNGTGSGSNLKKSRYFDDDSVSLGQSSPVQNQNKQAHKPTPQAPLSTSPPPGYSNGASSGFGKPQQKWTSESNGLGVTKSVSAAPSPSPPITNGAGVSMNTYPTPGGSTLVSPAPTQVTTAAVLRSASPSPTPKILVQPSPTPPPKSPSPTVGSPPPPTVKVPAIIREAPKPAVKSSASQQAQPGAPSIELERAKSLVPTQPIVPKPLTKNRGDLSSKQSKQFGQAKGGRGGAIMGSQTQLLRGGPIKKTELEGAKFDSNPPVQEEGESSEPVKPATPSPAKVLPRNNFFNSLRKQEEQKKNGSFIQSSSSGSNATSSAAPADTTAESESEQSSSQKDDGVATPPSTGIATEPEVVTTPTADEVEAETTATPTTTTIEKEAADETSGSDSATMIDLPEEEEQRLLKAFGWTPPDSEEEEELCIPDEEIQALRTQLDQHKQNFNQQREIRLLSLAQSVEQWQQRLFSSPTLCPIKSPN